MSLVRTRRTSMVAMGLVAALAVGTAACTGDDVDGSVEARTDTTVTDESGFGGGIDLSATRDDLDCSAEGLGEDESSEFTVAHYVVDGDLGALCFGQDDDRLLDAWEALAAIVPPGQLADLGLFGGFGAGGDADEVTLAFVQALDDEGSQFQMSVNLDEGDNDPDELLLTMAHEFSHVFTALPVEIDYFADPESCTTYDNGEGCYLEGSLMADWVADFWGNGLIDEIDPSVEASAAGGEDRCELYSGFLGPYAASNPEEDFAESFSAFVFDLPVDAPDLEDKLAWFEDRPGLVEFRDRARAGDLPEPSNNFEPCG